MKRISSRNYLSSMRVHLVPLLVWLGTLVVVVVLFAHQTKRYEVTGVAQGRIHQIAATCTGRLESISVELFEKVKKGQLLAVLNVVPPDEPTKSELEAQIATLDATIAQVAAESRLERADLIAQVDSRKTEWAADGRSFATDVSDTEFRVLELTTQIETDRKYAAELELAIRKFVIEGRLDVNDVAVYELQILKAQRATIAKRIEFNKRAREQLQREIEAMAARESEFKARHKPYLGTSDKDAEELRIKQIQVLERQKNVVLAQLASLQRRQSLELRSPIDGVIIPIPGNSNELDLQRPGENLLRRAGEVVEPADPVFAIARAEPTEIIAYVNERQVGRLQEGAAVKIVKNAEPAQIAASQITCVSPVVERIPVRLWTSPAAPQWGRAVLIAIPHGLKLVSGELVKIKGL